MSLQILENKKLKVAIKTFGAELVSLINKETGIEHIWQADPAIWARHAPILFPIVGQVENNAYRIGNKEYRLSQHGFARDMEFQLVSESSDQLRLVLQHSSETLEKYPYKFSLEVHYHLLEDQLAISYHVSNKDDHLIHFSLGAHPGFTCPFSSTELFSDYYLKFEREETVQRWMFDKGLLTGEKKNYLFQEDTIQLDYSLFQEDAIILEGLSSTWVDLRAKNQKVALRFYFEKFPLLAFWTSVGKNAPFLCIEPWFGIADTRGANKQYQEKEFIQKLDVGATFHCQYSLQLLKV